MAEATVNLPEEWEKWNPGNIQEGTYTVSDIACEEKKTKILLEDEKNIVTVCFNSTVRYVALSDTFTRPILLELVRAKYKDRNFYDNWFLYRLQKSRLAKWVEEEGYGLFEQSEMIHYCIVTEDDVIDVITVAAPEISVSPKGNC